MGRKIPGAKHRGIKDPVKQQEQRWAELKTKVNEPPKDVDEQKIPKSLERVMKLKDAVKSGRIPMVKKKNRKRSKNKLISLGEQNHKLSNPKFKPEKSVPVFNQRPGESKYHFWNRVNKETNNFINETNFETKFQVQVKRNVETGEIEGIEKTQKDELDKLMKHKNIGKKKKVLSEPKLSKAQKRKQKLEIKKAKKLQNGIDEFKSIRDNIIFGDVAHAPPELKVKPSKADKTITKRTTKNLLLRSLLPNENGTTETSKSISVNKTGKRKNLPAAERRILEKHQSDVIEAYKLMKTRKVV